MNTMRRRILSLGAGVVLLVPATLGAWGPSPAAADPAAVNAPAPAPVTAADFTPLTLAAPNPAVPDGYDLAAETPNLRLYINKSDSKLIIEDKRSGHLRTSNPLEPLGDQKSQLEDAVFQLNHTNVRKQMTNLAFSSSEQPQLTIQNIPGGVQVQYDLQKLKLKITVKYEIKDEPRVDGPGNVAYLQVTIPDGGIQELGDCKTPTSTSCAMVQSIELLPMFGAAPLEASGHGYILVPDQAGAIVNFKPEYPQYRQRYSSQIYGTDAASQAFQGQGYLRGGGTVRMPVWGLKQDDFAYLGIVTEGQYQANVNAYLAGYITNANRGSTEFIYRRTASIPRRRTLFVNRIEDSQIPGERQLRYVLLNGDDANYAGMAKAYRNYLMKDRGIKRLSQGAPRTLLSLLMGTTRRSAFRDDFLPMTRFDEAETIVQQFVDKGVNNLDVDLIGWNDGGTRGNWPRRYPADGGLGGNAGLKHFVQYAHKNGIRVFLLDNYLFGYTFASGGIIGQIPIIRNIWPAWSYGFNTRFDTIRGVNKLPVFSGGSTTNAFSLFLLNPVIARQRYVDRDFPTHKAMGIDGIDLNSVGYLLMSDTNDRYPLSRDQVAAEWNKVIDRSKAELGAGMAEGPSDYLLGHTDVIYDAPIDSRDAFGDQPVPFYHIALQGLVTRYSNANNLRNDPKTEFLRQVEWGMQPQYELTHQPSSDLIRTGFNIVYSSQYTDWVDPASQEYKQVRDEFGYLNSLFVTGHEQIAPRVFRVTYEDGSQLLVNYNNSAYDGIQGHVEPLNYLLRKGGQK